MRITEKWTNRRIEESKEYRFYFSYNEVIGCESIKENFVTEKKWSATTQKHISQFNLRGFEKVSQYYLDSLYYDIKEKED